MDELQVSKLLRSLSKFEANRIISSAGINRAIVFDNPIVFERDEIARLIPEVLRAIRTTDEQFRALLAESSIGARGDHYHPPEKVIITIPYAKDISGGDGIPVTELVSGSVIVWELSVRVAATLGATLKAAERLPPPEVLVSPGSSSFLFGGGTLIASGVAFVVAAHAGILPVQAAQLSSHGGAFLSSLGVIDMAINWYRTVNEARSLGSERRLNDAKTRLTEMDIAKARHDLEPASRLIAPEIVAAESRRFGLDIAVGTHLLNQVMPAYSELSHAHSGITASPANPQSRTAGA